MTWMSPKDTVLSEAGQLQKDPILFDSIDMNCPEQENPESERSLVVAERFRGRGFGRNGD